ncbi:Nup133 N terminal like-domain-containing protein [Tribonema minus]|uniref:Nup133 N terminal like-domain-containing protein n=1 Tax=Tribonema minus TaxID=303371 RepID=A0A835YRU3_9STRA|nr:Nup133 N terminal like-domain-containing protein [Tribonema minus]
MASAVGPGNGTSQDFSALADAHGEVVSHLLQDEAQNTTLYSQLLDNPGGAAHGYFCEPHTADQLGLPLELRSTIPLPAELLDLQQRMQVATFMGLLPELNHAWLSVDNALLLWNYVDGADVVKKFQELEQVIVAVGLAVPRQGVFKPLVKYLLVVATPVEVVLVAVTDGGDGRLDVRPTQFSASSDGVNMNAIRGHPCGRIFMAGKDGNLYELIYEAGGATGWLSYVGLGGSSGSRKCRKINRSTTPSSAVWNSFKQGRSRAARGAAITSPGPMAGLLVKRLPRVTAARAAAAAAILPGGGAGAASLLDLAVDPLRNALYTVDSTGVLRHYNLGPDGQQTVPVGGDLDLWAASGQFCRLHSTNRAQDVPDARAFEPGHGLEAVALSVVDACEDACVHLVVVASSGMRVYLGPSGRASEIDTAQATSPLRVLHVRAPPPAALWEHRKALANPAAGAAPPSQPPTGFAAGATRGGSAAGAGGRGGNAATAAYYAHRVTVVAQRAAGRGRGGSGGGLGLVAICESGVARLDQPQVSLAETALEIDPAGGVLAIEEHPTVLGDPAMASLLALTYTSGTPSAHNEIARQLAEANEDAPVAPPSARSQRAAHPPRAADGDPNAPPAGEVPPPPPLCLPPRGWLGGLRGARGVVPLRELATQHAAPQRRLLCLSGAGLHMVAKLRPLDVLHRLLRAAPPRPDLLQLFFDSYGHAEACAMCFAIACGLPNDATAPPETLPPTDVRRRVTRWLLQQVKLSAASCPPERRLDRHARDRAATAIATGAGVLLAADERAGPSAATRAAAVDALQRLGGAAHFAGSGDGDAGAAGGGSGDHGGMNGNGGGGGGGAVFNEEFRHSAQYLGLAQFLARLLRPAWFRPVAVAAVPLQGAPAAQPRPQQQQQRDARGGGGGTLPGDITLTLSEGDLEGMVEPLRELVALLRRVYRVAVQEDWLSKPRLRIEVHALFADFRRDCVSNDSVTFERMSERFWSSGASPFEPPLLMCPGPGLPWSTAAEPQQRGAYGAAAGHPDSAAARAAAQRARAAEALRRECMDVHRAYRLASRALQALKLLGILLDLRRKHPQCRAQWSALANVRLSQLVVGRGAHANAERLLAGLVGAQSGLGGDAEGHLARALRQECYLYFSQGDVLAHEGALALSQAEEKEAVDPGSVDARAESDCAVTLLTHAAAFWRGPRAAAPGGPLQLACARLARLRRYDGVGRVCLACAANFAGVRAAVERDGFREIFTIATVPANCLNAGARSSGPRARSRRSHFHNSCPQIIHRSVSDEVVGRPSWSAGADDLRTLGGWSPPPDVPRWELELYHGGSVGDAKGRDAAVEAVHGVLLGYLEDLVRGDAGADIRPGESPEMPCQPAVPTANATPLPCPARFRAAVSKRVEAALRRRCDAEGLISNTLKSQDDVYHARLYALLLRRDRVLLLRVDGERLEPWLRANDADLLHQLLRQRQQGSQQQQQRAENADVAQGAGTGRAVRYAKAALLELELAQEDGVPLEKRIAHLALAAADIR